MCKPPYRRSFCAKSFATSHKRTVQRTEPEKLKTSPSPVDMLAFEGFILSDPPETTSPHTKSCKVILDIRTMYRVKILIIKNSTVTHTNLSFVLQP